MKLIGPDGGDGLRAFLKDNRQHPHASAARRLAQQAGTIPHRRLPVSPAIGPNSTGSAPRCTGALQRFDVVLSPVAAFPAVPHGTSIGNDIFPGFSYTMTHNLTGWPAAVVRCGTSPAGLPIGVQIAAGPWREDLVLKIAARLESQFGGWIPSSVAGFKP